MMCLESCHFVVTGATGWLGRVTLDVLHARLGDAVAEKITAISRREARISLVNGQTIRSKPWEWLETFAPTGPVVVFHHAFVTKGPAGEMPRKAYRRANLEIRRRVERFLDRPPGGGLFVPSSGAAYAYLHKSAKEDDPLFIYGECKYEDEQVFGERAARRGWKAVLPRVFNLSGAHINHQQHYAVSSIILNCLRSEDVMLKADHPVWRSYYAAENLIALALKILAEPQFRTNPALDKEGPAVVSFDTAGEEIVEIGELARRCVRLLAGGAVKVCRPALREEPKDYYVGDATALRAWERRWGLKPACLDEQILTTANFLRRGQP